MTEEKPATLYCANHPTRETFLRCNRCEKPICTSCAVHTPTGYRCKECVREQQKTFETARPLDYVSAFFIAGILSFLGSLLIGRAGFFTIFLAPAAGWVIAEILRKATGKRRSKPLFRVAAGAAALGGLTSILPAIIFTLLGSVSPGILLSLFWPAIYTVIVTTTVYTRLSGIQITR
jgi:hypothetical protein